MVQNSCLVASQGWKHMDEFDYLPPRVRERVRESKYNLCCACLMEYILRYKCNGIEAIHMMERDIQDEGRSTYTRSYNYSDSRSDLQLADPRYMRYASFIDCGVTPDTINPYAKIEAIKYTTVSRYA